MKTADVIVVGAGIAGASAACELALSLRVLLLEAEAAPGFHSTGRSAAMLVNGYGSGVNQTLCQDSREFLTQPPEGFTPTPLLKKRDVLWLARRDQLGAYKDLMAANPGFHRISLRGALSRCPVLSESYLEGGCLALDDSAMEIDVHALHYGYLKTFRRRGGVLKTNTGVRSIERCSGSWQVRSQDETFECRYVINAAGAWADRVAAQAGVLPIGLTPMMRTVITFPAPPDIPVTGWPFVADINEEFYFKPEAGILLASPADEEPTAPCDVQAEEFGIACAVDRIERATTLQVTRIISKWAGLRTFAPDRSPVVGWDPEEPSFFWLAAQGGSGVMTAPALAKLSASLFTSDAASISQGPMGKLLADISPRRFKPEAARQNRSA